MAQSNIAEVFVTFVFCFTASTFAIGYVSQQQHLTLPGALASK